MNRLRTALATFALFLAASVALPGDATPGPHRGIDVGGMDPSVKPYEDFYQFANGGWVKRNPIPAAFSRWGSFDQLQENNQTNLLTILRAAANPRGAQGYAVGR